MTTPTQQVFIIEDDTIMQECIARAVLQSQKKTIIHNFSNVITAVQKLNQVIPDLIFLDILLGGPDGFSFLNELISYEDTNKIPIVIITSLNLSTKQLAHYNVVQILQKETMLPADITDLTSKILRSNTIGAALEKNPALTGIAETASKKTPALTNGIKSTTEAVTNA